MDITERLTVVPAVDRVLHPDAPAPAVLLLPGGGYARLAPRERDPVAHWLASIGLHVVVLDYPVAPDPVTGPLHPAPVDAAIAAMRWIRRGGHEPGGHGLSITAGPDGRARVGVLGFSAGGHLAATVSHADRLRGAGDAVPDFAVLCYPVVSLLEQPHVGSVTRLLGPDPDPALLAQLSLAGQVHPGTPPTFLWHTATDAGVPVSHSLGYADALARAGVPVELHVFPAGPHGLALAPDQPVVRQWLRCCEDWLRRTVMSD